MSLDPDLSGMWEGGAGMQRNNIYLDTSILNFFFEKRDIEKARIQ
jgi:hypothetical protein